MFKLKGWVELDGRKLNREEVRDIVMVHPEIVRKFGGEFYISLDNYCARDHFGIISGDCPPGTIRTPGHVETHVNPDPVAVELEAAIIKAVSLRSDEGVTALSGGVDSTLVAALARRPCVAVGIEGSHDLVRARIAAESTGLNCEFVTVTKKDVEEGISAVVPVIPSTDPVNTAIAVTMHCITKWAGEHGYTRVIAGQGADELFGGYSRYLTSTDLGADLEADFLGLVRQAERDQAVAALHGTYISMPYLDIRVVRAAHSIPAHEKVVEGVRKRPLRLVAERHIPPGIAWYDKKAMQYGSGVWRTIRELARHNGYKRSVQGYINQFGERDHGI
jgi:asparagine synthase (glutamine-hydrolysing)